MINLALMAPAGAMHRFNGSFARSLHYSPLTLTTLAGLVPPELDINITIYDETTEVFPREIDADLIGMTLITGTSQRAYKWADYYRSKSIPVVLGGIHSTLLPDEAKLHADAVVVGNAEQSWQKLLIDFISHKMLPFYFSNGDPPFSQNVIPRRDLLKKNSYITTNTVEVVRGCHHYCNFCVIPTIYKNEVWTRPVRDVIDEIEKLPGKIVVFADVNLIANPGYAKEFFKELAPLNKTWFGLVTTSITENDELFELMVKSGCKGLLIGFESVVDTSLSSVNKPFNRTRQYSQLIDRLHNNGIGINGTFVFGSDGDDKSVFEKTVEFVQKNKIDLPRYAVFTPFPGTELFNQLDKQKRIIEKNWALYDVEHCVIKPAQMSPEELESGLSWAWQETYKINSIIKRTFSFDKLFVFDILLNAGYKMYAHKLHKFPKSVMIDNSDIPAV